MSRSYTTVRGLIRSLNEMVKRHEIDPDDKVTEAFMLDELADMPLETLGGGTFREHFHMSPDTPYGALLLKINSDRNPKEVTAVTFYSTANEEETAE